MNIARTLGALVRVLLAPGPALAANGADQGSKPSTMLLFGVGGSVPSGGVNRAHLSEFDRDVDAAQAVDGKNTVQQSTTMNPSIEPLVSLVNVSGQTAAGDRFSTIPV